MKQFTLWIGNNINQEEQKSYQEIKDLFMASKFYQEYKKGQWLESCLKLFIFDKEGLNASYEEKDFTDLYNYINKEVRG
ncbi:MAG: hypothetical protein JXQ68_08000 [Campylobacterales bacterium]|nr:hypothetical protein [Campylobacterales bacterium]